MLTHPLMALAGFAFVSSITPGPNNLMLMASGANFGLRRSLPHMLGVSLGHGFLVLCIGLGLAALFARLPGLQHILSGLALLYMLWLAWKIATSVPVSTDTPTQARPLSFLQAAAFQWVNPKGWAMGMTAITVYAGDGWRNVVLAVLVFAAVNLPSVSVWAILGTQIARWLHTPRHMRIFNVTMALLLLLTLVMILGPGPQTP